jgi:hypothetical protein
MHPFGMAPYPLSRPHNHQVSLGKKHCWAFVREYHFDEHGRFSARDDEGSRAKADFLRERGSRFESASPIIAPRSLYRGA